LIAVMKSGKILEFGRTAQVFANPSHPYTQALLDSIPGRDWSAAAQ
jgi:peptide/nickel transport system ATP-binding protein